MNYSEMSDFEINKAAALAAGYQLRSDFQSLLDEFAPGCVNVIIDGSQSTFDPCNSWTDAGPIIEANKIAMIPESDGTWFALGNPQIKINWRVESTGAFHNDTTPLRAAMIVFLMMQEQK